MKRFFLTLALILCLVAPAPSLTTKERASVQKVRELVVKAKEENASITIYAAEADKRAVEAESKNLWSWNEAQRLEADVKTSQDEKQKLANWKLKYEPVIKQVNSWFGIGAILYGLKKLAFSALILGVVLAVVGVLLFFFVPPAIPFIKMIGLFFRRLFDKLFRRK